MGGIGLFVLLFIIMNRMGDPVRRLQRGATDIHSYMSEVGFTGDHSRRITARCSKEFFISFALQEGLQPVPGGVVPQKIPSWQRTGEGWWNPPEQSANLYLSYHKRYRTRVLMTYSNGILYYDKVEW